MWDIGSSLTETIRLDSHLFIEGTMASRVIAFACFTGFLFAHSIVRAADDNDRVRIPDHRIDSISLSPDGRFLVGASAGITAIQIWNTGALLELRKIQLDVTPVLVRCSPDGKTFVVCTGSLGVPTMFVANLADGRITQSLRPIQGGTWDATFSPDGSLLAVCGNGARAGTGECAVVRTKDWSSDVLASSKDGPFSSVAFFPDIDNLTSSNKDLFQLNRRNLQIALVYDRLDRGGFVASTERRQLAAFDAWGVDVIDVDTGVRHRLPRSLNNEEKLPAGFGSVTAAQFVPGTSLLAVGYHLGGVAVWDLSIFKRIHLLRTFESVRSVAVSGNGKVLAVGGGIHKGEVKVWFVEQLLQKDQ